MSIKCLKETLNKIYKNYNNDDAFCLSNLENNEMKYSFCKGNLNNKKIVNINTKFNIGSISKMFVVIIILKIVNQKLIQLDEPVVNHFPNFRMKDSRYIYYYKNAIKSFSWIRGFSLFRLCWLCI